MVTEEVAGGSDEVYLQFRAEKLDKKVSLRIGYLIKYTVHQAILALWELCNVIKIMFIGNYMCARFALLEFPTL